jgi:hypothetical protein
MLSGVRRWREERQQRRKRREKCLEALNALVIPEPFSAARFCDALSEREGKPILILPMTQEQVEAVEGADGYVRGFKDRYEIRISPWAQNPEFTITHEGCHIGLGHVSVEADDPPSTVYGTISRERLGLYSGKYQCRGRYDTEEDKEAELLAMMIEEAVSERIERHTDEGATSEIEEIAHIEAFFTRSRCR